MLTTVNFKEKIGFERSLPAPCNNWTVKLAKLIIGKTGPVCLFVCGSGPFHLFIIYLAQIPIAADSCHVGQAPKSKVCVR